jgi:hypothetical protein
MQVLNELSNEENLIGVLLQELSVESAEPKVTNDNGTIVRFETVLQDTKPNRNKRIYPESILSEAIKAPRIQELLRTRTLLGEAGHPFVPDMARQMQIDMTRVSHLVTDINLKSGGVITGVVETAATTCGKDMYGLIVHNKSNVAFSMRGMGGIKKLPNDLVEVTKPFVLFTYDWVIFPSHVGAYAGINKPANVSEGYAGISVEHATNYARDQSKNVKILSEQFELENPDFTLTEDQMNLIVKTNQSIIKVFLEEDIRQDFRKAVFKLF